MPPVILINIISVNKNYKLKREENSRSKKKIGIVTLLKVLLSNYPGSLEADMIEIIYDIRKKYNNSLTGISLRQILKESETLFLNMQKFHILYDENYSETSTKVSESNQQNVQEIASSVSRPKRDTVQRKSISSLPFESKLKNKQSCSLNQIQMQLPSKKAWDVIPPTTVKWSPSNESECSVCMNQLKKINSYILSCGHFFHTQCIKKWMKTDSSCPNCRCAVTNIDEFPPLGI